MWSAPVQLDVAIAFPKSNISQNLSSNFLTQLPAFDPQDDFMASFTISISSSVIEGFV
jgi:hypothetical protein